MASVYFRMARLLGLSCAFGFVFLGFSRRAHGLIASEMSLELRGSTVSTSDGRVNSALFIELNVPLDPRRPASVHSGLLEDEQTAPVDDVPLDTLERDNVESPELDLNDAAFGEPAGIADPLALDRQFLADVAQAALVAQGCDDAWARLEHLGTRNRVSALLPEVALRAGRERDTALRLTPTDTDPYRYSMSGATNLLLEARVSWRLGRLLFSTEDLGIERLRLARSRERQRVVERTLAILFRWLRAQSELTSGRKMTPRQVRAAKWERTQAEMRLDVLTAGWFSAHSPSFSPRNTEDPNKPKPSEPGAAAPNPEGHAPSKTQEVEAPIKGVPTAQSHAKSRGR